MNRKKVVVKDLVMSQLNNGRSRLRVKSLFIQFKNYVANVIAMLPF